MLADRNPMKKASLSTVACLCGQPVILSGPAAECAHCKRLHLPPGVVGTTRQPGDLRQFVFHHADGSLMGTDDPSGTSSPIKAEDILPYCR